MRKIWLRSDVDINKEYVLLLCDDGKGGRYYELCEITQIEERARNPDCVFVTNVIPSNLALNRDLRGIAESVTLRNGDPFYCDSHCDWRSKEEMEDWINDKPYDSIRWVRGTPPIIAPR